MNHNRHLLCQLLRLESILHVYNRISLWFVMKWLFETVSAHCYNPIVDASPAQNVSGLK